MNYIKCPIRTICVGQASSFGAIILSNGTKGKRFATPNAKILIHQPLIYGGISGQTSDIKIRADNLQNTRNRLTQLLSENTGQSFEKVWKDTERDYIMSSEEALEYGIIDKILYKRD